MTIVVTGGAGYIGSTTVECLQRHGERVVVLDDLSHGHRAALPADVPFYQGKIGDRELVTRITREHSVESCIHFAGLIEVGESVRDPAAFYENNGAQGIALIGALVQCGVRRIVFSSTCATYSEPKQIPIPESCPQWPSSPYGWTKLFLERVLLDYGAAYGLRSVALRYFNAAGATEACGEDHHPETHLIPNVLLAALGQVDELRVFGDNYPTPDGTPIRDYVHVADLAEAHVLALEYLRKGGASEAFNVGTGQGYSVLEVIECAREVTGAKIPYRQVAPRPGDSARLVADSTRAQTVLGWKPVQSDLRSILRSAWAWRQRRPRGYAAGA